MEDKCDTAIKIALEKGPKRVRIASREELKIEVNKYKNMSLRLMEELKRNGIKSGGGKTLNKLESRETGLREEKEAKEFGAQDHLDAMSEGGRSMDFGGSIAASDADPTQEIERLKDQIVRNNMDLKDNETIEDIKVQVYSRDKTIDLQ
eukprot:CAMPEP_0176397428 /NCGR_PEP_ID=MMETSP0126-20121128/45118_1 /TAXON_ID=141414 ORGANISM="Strombidinopsis acuminatum, Strain SPMC142" /NCGR_SAMPLE_ID=MMETSP0126 /ASSEMBLY_ACC=CAM_ASM_000229 /LENGTH=148 /DNA_ID=CAMNT_0017771735 /DNA_START=210 /DNA_END=656 /DNA_ORIENTATION=+